MATQRLTVVGLAGASVDVVVDLFYGWHDHPDALAVDRFCEALREYASSLPISYFAEWMDRWLMGDIVPGPAVIDGSRFQTACMSPQEADAWASRCGQQFPEQGCLAARLHEAADAWSAIAERRCVVVMRQVLGPSITDDEVRESLVEIPGWLVQ